MKNSKKGANAFLTLIFAITCLNVNAQMAGKSMIALRHEKPYKPALLNYPPIPWSLNYPASTVNFLQTSLNISPITQQSAIPNFHRYEHLPFFCKFEVKLEQTFRLPFKFRLGEVGYVDRLEGKRDEY